MLFEKAVLKKLTIIPDFFVRYIVSERLLLRQQEKNSNTFKKKKKTAFKSHSNRHLVSKGIKLNYLKKIEGGFHFNFHLYKGVVFFVWFFPYSPPPNKFNRSA